MKPKDFVKEFNRMCKSNMKKLQGLQVCRNVFV